MKCASQGSNAKGQNAARKTAQGKCELETTRQGSPPLGQSTLHDVHGDSGSKKTCESEEAFMGKRKIQKIA